MANLPAIHRYIEAHKQEHIAKVQEFLRQPSISAESVGIRECAELLASYYRALGCQEVTLIETDGHPGVWACYDAGAPKSFVNYCMYDVQPVVGETWETPPFEAALVRQDPFPLVVRARGAINSKGPYRMWLNALEAIIAVEGRLPINIFFTAEGEEELGSPHLSQIVNRYTERMKGASALFDCGANQDAEGSLELALGNKGIVYFELECSGAKWGRGPKAFDIHSSYKAVVDSPAWRLTQALSSMVTPDGNRVLIEGWYDKVAPPTSEDVELLDALAKEWSDAPWKQMLQVDRWVNDETDRKLLHRYMFTTSLGVDGIWGGYTGPGTKTVLPHKVTVKLDARLVPNQEAEDIIPLVRRHLDKHGFTDIESRQLGGYPPSKTSVKEPAVQAVLEVYRRWGVKTTVWPLIAGSGPMHLYTRPPLSLPALFTGLGHGGRYHSPDEYLVIEGDGKVAGLVEAEKSYVDIVYAFAER